MSASDDTKKRRDDKSAFRRVIEATLIALIVGLVSGIISGNVSMAKVEVRLDYIEKGVDRNTRLIENHMMGGHNNGPIQPSITQ